MELSDRDIVSQVNVVVPETETYRDVDYEHDSDTIYQTIHESLRVLNSEPNVGVQYLLL